jgi:uracil-DNA glycosylase
VSAKDRLRAYLEQRRELGESELVLDALDVDDVMRMLGALSLAEDPSAPRAKATKPTEERTAPPVPMSDSVRAVAADPPIRVENDVRESPPLSDDWREMMRTLKADAPVPPASDSVADPAPAASENVPAPVARTAGTLRIEGLVYPLGMRVERTSVRPAEADNWSSLDDVAAAISACTRCTLVQTATKPVPGVGNPDADVMVIGEAPGEQEDLRGEPFVGPAGELLDKILAAIQLDRTTVYIANVLKHRPPHNRTPLPDEVRACAPFLQRQIDLVQPKLIIALGNSAAHALLGTKLAMGKLRQQVHWYQGIPLVATYHPAALLRNDAWKRPTWEDVKLARRVLDATIRV